MTQRFRRKWWRGPRGSTMPALRHAANPPVSLYLQAGLFALSALLSFVACPGRPWTTYSYTVFERRRVPTATRIASRVREPRARCVAHLIAGHSTRAAFRPPRELGLDPARAASRSFDRCAPCRGCDVILPHPPPPPPRKGTRCRMGCLAFRSTATTTTTKRRTCRASRR